MAIKERTSTLAAASLASVSSLVLLQLFTRTFTFGLNRALIRLASPQTFGTAAIQFELLLSSILFLSREGVRNALLRSPSSLGHRKDAAQDTKTVVSNISLVPVYLGIPIAILTSFVYVRSSSLSTYSQPYFVQSVTVYALAAFLELLSEPLYIRAQNDLRFEIRVRAEGTAVMSKTLITFLILTLAPDEWALFAFAAGQAAYGFSCLVVFFRAYSRDMNYLPRQIKVTVHGNTKSVYFDQQLLNLSMAMTGQSVVKHFLTEGDKFLVSRLSPLEDQGGYAIASNYGSLIARIVFNPIEETSRLYFSKLLTPPTNEQALRSASEVLTSLLLLMAHLLLLMLTFGPPFLPLATSFLLPASFQATSAPAILRSYIIYIPMMAFNGVLEAFFASTSSPTDLRNQSRWMILFSFGFICAAVGFNRAGLGDSGLVYANILNLFARVIYCWVFTKRYFKERGRIVDWKDSIPPKGVLGVFTASAIITRWSWNTQGAVVLSILEQKSHVIIGVSCFALCLCTCVILERVFLRNVMQVMREKQKKQ